MPDKQQTHLTVVLVLFGLLFHERASFASNDSSESERDAS